MRITPKFLAGLAFIGLFLILAFALSPLRSSYLRFHRKSPQYYAELARACASVLAEHPPGTNKFIRIPVSDPSLPQPIRSLGPSRITVSWERVHLSVGEGRGDFGIAWESVNETQWQMKTYAEGLEKIVYQEKRTILRKP
jgi:hypothetical protein